uniref:Uncharacterized protein n=1 Tax=Solanum lycopersicum TaxID=4081 RepID=A0A3Q7ISW8_SOLLC
MIRSQCLTAFRNSIGHDIQLIPEFELRLELKIHSVFAFGVGIAEVVEMKSLFSLLLSAGGDGVKGLSWDVRYQREGRKKKDMRRRLDAG